MYFPKHDGRALVERQLAQRGPHTAGGLPLLQHPIRQREAARLGKLDPLDAEILDGHLLPLPAATPPAEPVGGLIDDYPVDPGAKRGLTTELAQGPKYTQEDFLGEVERFLGIAK